MEITLRRPCPLDIALHLETAGAERAMKAGKTHPQAVTPALIHMFASLQLRSLETERRVCCLPLN